MLLSLDTCVEFINGGAWPESEYAATGIHVVKVTNLINGSIEKRKDSYLPKSKFEEYKKHKLQTGDLIIATVGSHPTQQGSVVGRTSRVPREFNESFLNQNAVCLRSKLPDVLNIQYLYYLTKTKAFKWYIEGRAKGSANQVRMALGDLKRFTYNFPKIEVQRKIAAILAAYDELIENNNRRIALLEKMAEEIYREWFVRFRFPGFQEENFHKGIPSNWKITKIKQIVDRKKFGKIYRENDLNKKGDVIVIDQSRAENLGFYDGTPEHFASFDEPMILFGDHTCKMVLMHRNFSLAENVIPFLPKNDIPTLFLFHLIKNKAVQTEYKRHWTELTVQNVLLPNTELQKQYSELVKPFYQAIEQFKSQVRILTDTRDMLLPRLISGKLPVEDLDIQFPPGMQEAGAA